MPDLAMHLAQSAFGFGFEPSLFYRLKLDHVFVCRVEVIAAPVF